MNYESFHKAKMRLFVVWVCSKQDSLSTYLHNFHESPSVLTLQQVRRLAPSTTLDDDRISTAVLLDQLLAGSSAGIIKSPVRKRSLLLQSLVKRQPFQCLVNVVACWKR